jgi:hypothetical protein
LDKGSPLASLKQQKQFLGVRHPYYDGNAKTDPKLLGIPSLSLKHHTFNNDCGNVGSMPEQETRTTSLRGYLNNGD